MKRAVSVVHIMVVLVLASTWAAPASGAGLCQKRSGVLVIRTDCKRKEALVDVAALGLMGPKGDQGSPGVGPLTSCPPDAVLVGTTCVDTYEASVWRVPGPTAVNQGLVTKIQNGEATAADLTAGGATQLGVARDDYVPCADSGQNCTNDIYAVSLPAVLPSANLMWFQAQQACKNACKRLPWNAEWQTAVAGTPDAGPDNGTTDCHTASGFVAVATGSRSSCVSSDGAFDMVGNLFEWVADWMPRSTTCGTWSAGVSPTGDSQCLGGAATTGEPGALLRGGNFFSGTSAGPLTVLGSVEPSLSVSNIGLRCAR